METNSGFQGSKKKSCGCSRGARNQSRHKEKRAQSRRHDSHKFYRETGTFRTLPCTIRCIIKNFETLTVIYMQGVFCRCWRSKKVLPNPTSSCFTNPAVYLFSSSFQACNTTRGIKHPTPLFNEVLFSSDESGNLRFSGQVSVHLGPGLRPCTGEVHSFQPVMARTLLTTRLQATMLGR